MCDNLNRQRLLAALKKNELNSFLMGKGIYRIGYNPYAPGNTFLNLGPAMHEIYSYYKAEPEKRIDLELEKSLIQWLDWKSGIGVYGVFSFLSYVLKKEKENKSPFKINSEKLINELRKHVLDYKDKLKERKEFEGENLENGLWEAMMIENENNIDKYGIKIL